jgi:hypothetical protein
MAMEIKQFGKSQILLLASLEGQVKYKESVEKEEYVS